MNGDEDPLIQRRGRPIPPRMWQVRDGDLWDRRPSGSLAALEVGRAGVFFLPALFREAGISLLLSKRKAHLRQKIPDNNPGGTLM